MPMHHKLTTWADAAPQFSEVHRSRFVQFLWTRHSPQLCNSTPRNSSDDHASTDLHEKGSCRGSDRHTESQRGKQSCLPGLHCVVAHSRDQLRKVSWPDRLLSVPRRPSIHIRRSNVCPDNLRRTYS